MVLLVFLALFVIGTISLPSDTSQDPAGSWLAYVIGPGNGKLVTWVNATWTVPSYPTIRTGGPAPGWWFGIEPIPAMNLIQPILAYGYTGDFYGIFNGYYQWDNSDWWSSDVGQVSPGNTVYAYVSYNPSSHSYDMFIACKETGWSVKSNIPIEGDKVYTDVYFVVEHQPDDCGEFPTNGEIVFANITVAWQNTVQKPAWNAQTFDDACNCTPSIIDSQTLKFTWQSS